ncbi:hypothetical protein C9J12_25565 [Photobacterium frigidiphilum]|uniref:Uncharacterized protein n=1 Tax=Photobacterium frigidiphilum TaxID=264736 RepID=A0A2T3J7N4_9GAMM|nr:hypothetical protein [Photobacterium frigidiphilum]PSU44769.1 hypothetical protein C9J12_25565 [Photobacterium frigidiphilum]
MDLKNRKRREDRPKSDKPLTTITAVKKSSTKQDPPTCYRFSDYDKAEIALAVTNANANTAAKVTPAKLIRALVRLNNSGHVDEQELAKMIESL